MSERITFILIQNGIILEENKELYCFGLSTLFWLFADTITILILGIVFHAVSECCLFIATFVPLRTFAGGVHAKTQLSCYYCTTIIASGVLLVLKYVAWPIWCSLLLLAVSAAVIWRLAPVEDKHKPLDEMEIRVYKKRTRAILTIEIAVVLLLIRKHRAVYCVAVSIFIMAIVLLLGRIKNVRLEKKRNNYESKKIASLGIVFLLLLFRLMPVMAEDREENIYKEIIFLVDLSGSMSEIDEEHFVADSIRQIVATAPMNYRFGIVAYDTDIRMAYAPAAFGQEEEWLDELLALEYGGYTNTGKALKDAVSMFSNEVGERRILLISDGEIDMESEVERQSSISTFDEIIQQMKAEDIQMDLFFLESSASKAMESEQKKSNLLFTISKITSGAKESGGNLYLKQQPEMLSQTVQTYLYDDLKVPRKVLGVAEAAKGEVSVVLPDTEMENVKILLTGEGKIADVNVNCQSKSMKITSGRGFSVVHIDKPLQNEIYVTFRTEDAGQIEACEILQYEIDVKAKVVYIPEREIAEIALALENKEGKSILNDGRECDRNVRVWIDGQEMDFELKDGKIYLPLCLSESKEIETFVEVEEAGGLFYIEQAEKIFVDVPYVEEEPEPPSLAILMLVLVGLAMTIILILCLHKNANRKSQKTPKFQKKGNLSSVFVGKVPDYEGKINVYITKSRQEEDFSPHSMKLYGKPGNELLTLGQILKICNLNLQLNDTDQIRFLAGEGRALLVENFSGATILKGREMLLKERRYAIYFDEKITIFYEEQETEIEIHYKNVKPSER